MEVLVCDQTANDGALPESLKWISLRRSTLEHPNAPPLEQPGTGTGHPDGGTPPSSWRDLATLYHSLDLPAVLSATDTQTMGIRVACTQVGAKQDTLTFMQCNPVKKVSLDLKTHIKAC